MKISFCSRAIVFAGVALLGTIDIAYGQQAIAVGKGSYAEFPPEGISQDTTKILARTDLHVVDLGNRPVPTNKFWTNLLLEGKNTDLWTYPLKVVVNPPGLKIFYPTTWGPHGDIITDAPLEITADGFNPADAKAVDWGDWTLRCRLADGDRKMDVTVGEGMPYVWMECAGLSPKIGLGTDDDAQKATFFDDAGQTQSLPASGDHLGILLGGRAYGIFVPDGTQFANDGKAITVTFPTANGFLVVCPLPAAKDLGHFHQYAFAVPRQSKVDWKYDPQSAMVSTTWTLTTECLKGSEHAIIQGWLPHHLRKTTNDLHLDETMYRTPRGDMKCSTGTQFKIAWPFRGFLPYLPAPKPLGLPNDFDPTRMKNYLAMAAKHTQFADDTYWGGKDILLSADYMQMAKELHDDSFATLRDTVLKSLTDWFTYTPGETSKFFARYPYWHAMIGFHDSYGSGQFNDQHFHYGYYTLATAKLAMVDPAFLNDYGPMARLVAKEYANSDRNDLAFPFMRTMDLWAGHSWAGGIGSAGGNNQESSSEAVQSWVGLFLLGTMLNDQDMIATGAMGYAMETQAANEYWFNAYGGNFPPTYDHSTVGMVWSGGQAYGTYFSGDPAWIYGINWLPWSPACGYLTEDRAFARKSFETMLESRKLTEKQPALEDSGSGLGNVLLNYESQFDPDTVAQKMDELWQNNNSIAHDNATGGLTYYRTHITRDLGFPVLDQYSNVPTSCIYQNERTHALSYVGYNAAAYPRLFDVYQNNTRKGSFLVPASDMAVATQLFGTKPGVVATVPAIGRKDVSRFLDRICIAFDQPVNPSTLIGTKINGPGNPQLHLISGGDLRAFQFQIDRPLQPRGTYQITLPSTVQSKAGESEGTFAGSFTVESEPPLAVDRSEPADGAERVPLDLKSLHVMFNCNVSASTVTGVLLTDGKTKTRLTATAGSAGEILLSIPLKSLLADHSYSVKIPAGVSTPNGTKLKVAREITFSTAPSPCPPNVYSDSFAGAGHSNDDSLTVDFRNTESPHSGKYAMKLTAGDSDGTVYLFAGTSDNGAGRAPVDLSRYKKIEFWMKGSTDHAWIKIGHPVYDDGAFHLDQVHGVTDEYQKFEINLPDKKDTINTLLAISVSKGKTLFVDDIRFVE